MQGVILNIIKVKEEDLIVTLLTKKRLKKLYRFYGARHSSINLGYLIDFVPVYTPKSTIGMLREVIHLGYSWQLERDKFFYWQQFIKLLNKHLQDVEELDEFYFNLLQNASLKLSKQNPKRVLIESYLELLDFEGRLHKDFYCFICEEEIKNNIVLKRAFLTAHDKCLIGKSFDKQALSYLFKNKNTLYLHDNMIEELWNILLEGF